MKKTVSLLLALLMLLTIVPATVWAGEGAVVFDNTVEVYKTFDPTVGGDYTDSHHNGIRNDIFARGTNDEHGGIFVPFQQTGSEMTLYLLSSIELSTTLGGDHTRIENNAASLTDLGTYTDLNGEKYVYALSVTPAADRFGFWVCKADGATYLDMQFVKGGGGQDDGPHIPEGTRPVCFHDNGGTEFYNGAGVDRGQSRTFDQLFDERNGNAPITGLTVESTTTPGLTAVVNGDSLTVTASADCQRGEQYVIVNADGVRYSLRIKVNGGGQDFNNAWTYFPLTYREGEQEIDIGAKLRIPTVLWNNRQVDWEYVSATNTTLDNGEKLLIGSLNFTVRGTDFSAWQEAYNVVSNNGMILEMVSFNTPDGAASKRFYFGGGNTEALWNDVCAVTSVDESAGGPPGGPENGNNLATVNDNGSSVLITGCETKNHSYAVAWGNNEGAVVRRQRIDINITPVDFAPQIMVSRAKVDSSRLETHMGTGLTASYNDNTGICCVSAQQQDYSQVTLDRPWEWANVIAPDGAVGGRWECDNGLNGQSFTPPVPDAPMMVALTAQNKGTPDSVYRTTYTIHWQMEDGAERNEDVTLYVTGQTTWMSTLKEAAPAVVDMTKVQQDLAGSGISFAYNPVSGCFYTRFDSSIVPTVEQMQYEIPVVPADGAVYYKLNRMSGNGGMFMDDGQPHTGEKNSLQNCDLIPIESGETFAFPIASALQQTVDGVSVWFAEDQKDRGVVYQWFDKDEKLLGTTYIYGANEPFVFQSIGECFDGNDLDCFNNENKFKAAYTSGGQPVAVTEPTLIGGWGETAECKLRCEMFPQTGEDSYYFRLNLVGGNGNNGQKIVYLPYSFMGKDMSYAAAKDLPTPTIRHFNNAHRKTESIPGEYTPYGIRFVVNSFSPFTLNWGENSGEDAIVVNGVGIYTEINQGVPGYQGENHDGIRTVTVDPQNPHDCIQVPFHQAGDYLRLFLVTEDELNTSVIAANKITLTWKEKLDGKNVYWLELTPAGDDGFGFWVKKADGAELLDFWFEKRDDGGQGGDQDDKEPTRTYTTKNGSVVNVYMTPEQMQVATLTDLVDGRITVRVIDDDPELWKPLLEGSMGFTVFFDFANNEEIHPKAKPGVVSLTVGSEELGVQGAIHSLKEHLDNGSMTFGNYDETERGNGISFAWSRSDDRQTLILPKENVMYNGWILDYGNQQVEDGVIFDVALDESLSAAIVLDNRYVPSYRLHYVDAYSSLGSVLSPVKENAINYQDGTITYYYLGNHTEYSDVNADVVNAAKIDKVGTREDPRFGERIDPVDAFVIEAPEGYEADHWTSTNGGREDYQNGGSMTIRYDWNGLGDSDTFTLCWRNHNGERLDEKITLHTDGTGYKKWMDYVATPFASERVELPMLTDYGVVTTYDQETGLLWTEYATPTKLKVGPVLDAMVKLTPPDENVVSYQFLDPGDGADNPVFNGYNVWLDHDTLKQLLDGEKEIAIAKGETVEQPLNALKEQVIGDIRYYYSADKSSFALIVKWNYAEDSQRAPVYEYVWLDTSPYVCTVTTDVVDNDAAVPVESNGVVNPVAVASKSNIKLTTRKYPQNDSGRYFFELEITENNGNVIEEFDETEYRIILPYAFMGEGWSYASVTAAGMKPPIINHYDKQYHQLVGNEGAIQGVFTERGIEFTVTSFSPFMLTWQNLDLNGDGAMNIIDMACLFTYLSTGENEGKLDDAAFEKLADVNGDGDINILDYQKLYEDITREKQ